MNWKKFYEEDLHSTKKESTTELAWGLNKCIIPFFTVVSMEMLVCSIDIFPLFLRQIGMYFIYETCNNLNCHHFKNTKIAYYISVNVIISLTNSSLATIFP